MTNQDYKTIRIETDGDIGQIILNRPDRLNALSATALRELTHVAHWFDEQREIRVVSVRGEGRAFCAGADLSQDSPIQAPADADWFQRREVGQIGTRMADAIENMRAVTIAQLHGHVVGGGLVLMTACDFRIAAEGTVFSIPEVDVGIPLTWGAIPRLVRDIGPARTKELVMTCRQFDSAEAESMGLINQVVDADRLVTEVKELAELLAGKPSVPIAITKEHVNAVGRGMVAASTMPSDGDVLLSAIRDPDSIKAAMAYFQSMQSSKKK